MIKLEDNEIRKEIENLFFGKNRDAKKLASIEGIDLVEERDWKQDQLNGFNCFFYVFRGEKLPLDLESPSITTTTKGYSEVENPLEGDLVIYVDTKLEEQSHVGFYHRGKVLSKWTYGGIYLHDFDKVPSCYGDLVGFFRKR